MHVNLDTVAILKLPSVPLHFTDNTVSHWDTSKIALFMGPDPGRMHELSNSPLQLPHVRITF